MDNTRRYNVKIGADVKVVQKQEQGSRRLTEGIDERILTSSPEHPHGIKAMLEDGTAGRVKEIR